MTAQLRLARVVEDPRKTLQHVESVFALARRDATAIGGVLDALVSASYAIASRGDRGVGRGLPQSLDKRSIRNTRRDRHNRTRGPPRMTRIDSFSTTLFQPGAELVAKKGKHPHVVALQPLGNLHLPTGRLVIHSSWERFPLRRTAPIGVFAVEASLSTVSSSESRFAAIRIVFSREPVVAWEVADQEFGAARGLKDATCVYADAQVLPALQTYIDESNSPDEWYYDPPKLEGKTWQSACFAPDDDRAETVVMFDTNSYNSDGPYISYWGLDAAGMPAMFVTDLDLVA